jgi:hypothetical protein
MQFAAHQNISGRTRIGGQELGFDSNLPDELQDRVRSLKALRARFKEQAIFFDCADLTSHVVCGFKKRYRDAEPLQPEGAGESRNPAADDDDLPRIRHGHAR